MPRKEKKSKARKAHLHNATDLLLPDGCEILQRKAVVFDPIHQLLNPNPGLNPHRLLLLIHLQNPIHQRQIHHPGPRQPDPVGREARPDRPDPGLLLIGLLDHILQLLEVLWLVEHPGLDLVSAAPVGDSVEVFGQRGVAEDLGLLMLGVLREGEGVVGGSAAEDEQRRVAQVLAELGVTGFACGEWARGGWVERVFGDGGGWGRG